MFGAWLFCKRGFYCLVEYKSYNLYLAIFWRHNFAPKAAFYLALRNRRSLTGWLHKIRQSYSLATSVELVTTRVNWNCRQAVKKSQYPSVGCLFVCFIYFYYFYLLLCVLSEDAYGLLVYQPRAGMYSLYCLCLCKVVVCQGTIAWLHWPFMFHLKTCFTLGGLRTISKDYLSLYLVVKSTDL